MWGQSLPVRSRDHAVCRELREAQRRTTVWPENNRPVLNELEEHLLRGNEVRARVGARAEAELPSRRREQGQENFRKCRKSRPGTWEAVRERWAGAGST